MFTLVAATKKPVLDGIVATRRYETQAAAEEEMRNWARFGVENQCNEADAIYICDARGALVSRWDYRLKRPVPGT